MPLASASLEEDGKGPWLGKVDAITAKLESGAIGVVQAEGEIDVVLQEAGLLEKQFLNCRSIGKDPASAPRARPFALSDGVVAAVACHLFASPAVATRTLARPAHARPRAAE